MTGTLLEFAILGVILGAAIAALDQAYCGPVYRWSARWMPWRAQLSTAPTAGFFTEQSIWPRLYAAAILCLLWLTLRAIVFDVDVVITMSFFLTLVIMVAALVAGSFGGGTFMVIVRFIGRALGTGNSSEPVTVQSAVADVRQAATADVQSARAAVAPVAQPIVETAPAPAPQSAAAAPEVVITPPPAPTVAPGKSNEDKLNDFTN